MKKILSVVLASAVLMLCLASCGTHAAAKALDEILAPVKNGDFENAYIIANSLFSGEDEELLTALYKNFDYTIGKVTETDGTALVSVTITMTDIGQIFMDYMAEAMSGNETSEDRFAEMLSDEDAPTKTFDVTVNMFKVNENWTLSEGADALTDALTGGLISTFEGIAE